MTATIRDPEDAAIGMPVNCGDAAISRHDTPSSLASTTVTPSTYRSCTKPSPYGTMSAP